MDKDCGSVVVIVWGNGFVMVPAVESLFAKAQILLKIIKNWSVFNSKFPREEIAGNIEITRHM